MRPTATTQYSTTYAFSRTSPLRLPLPLSWLGAFLGRLLTLRLFSRCGDCQPATASGSSLRGLGMGLVDRLGHLANVFSGFAFGLDGVSVNLAAVLQRQPPFRMLQVRDLRHQQRIGLTVR